MTAAILGGAAQPARTAEPRLAAHPAAPALLALALLAGVRFGALVGAGTPPGVDAGAWTTFGRALLTGDLEVALDYPPLVPLLHALVGALVGPGPGSALLAALASVAPGAGAFVLLAGRVGPGPAGLAAIALAASGAVSEATAWGGVPMLLGEGLLLLALHLLLRTLDEGGPRLTIAAAAAFAATAACSHFVAVFAAAAAACVVLVSAGGRRCVLRRAAAVGVWSTALALPLVPFYLRLSSATATVRDRTDFDAHGWGDRLRDLDGVFRESPWPWRCGVGAALVVPLLLLADRRSPAVRVAAALAVALAAAIVLTGEQRLHHLAPAVIVVSLAVWWQALRPSRAGLRMALAVALVVVVGVQARAGIDAFSTERARYAVVTPAVVDASGWIRSDAPADAVVAVPAIHGLPLGWWVEALADRRVLSASPLRWLNYADDQADALVANGIFDAGFPDLATLSEAAGAGIDLLLVPASWEGWRTAAATALVEGHPELVAHRSHGALVLRTGA